jgi:electron transport complex protein RnfG
MPRLSRRENKNKAARTLKAINLVGIDFDNDPMMEVLDLETGRVYVLREGEEISGYAIQARSLEGYGGLMEIMVGFNPDGLIQKTAVLSHRETPGLGSKVKEKPFASQFMLADPRTQDLHITKDGGIIDAISGATISSRAYTQAVLNSIQADLAAMRKINETQGGAAPDESALGPAMEEYDG